MRTVLLLFYRTVFLYQRSLTFDSKLLKASTIGRFQNRWSINASASYPTNAIQELRTDYPAEGPPPHRDRRGSKLMMQVASAGIHGFDHGTGIHATECRDPLEADDHQALMLQCPCLDSVYSTLRYHSLLPGHLVVQIRGIPADAYHRSKTSHATRSTNARTSRTRHDGSWGTLRSVDRTRRAQRTCLRDPDMIQSNARQGDMKGTLRMPSHGKRHAPTQGGSAPRMADSSESLKRPSAPESDRHTSTCHSAPDLTRSSPAS